MDRVFIYSLIDPRTNTPFYVGASKSPRTRLSYHCTIGTEVSFSGRVGFMNKKYIKITEIIAAGFKVRLKILKECSEINAGKWEKFYYNEYLNLGHVLLQRPVFYTKKVRYN